MNIRLYSVATKRQLPSGASLVAALVLFIGSRMGAHGAFTLGNLAVFSADSASANNTTFTILELSPSTANQSSPVNSIPINGTSGVNALRTSGSASSTGYLADSDDGTLLAFTAHNSTTSSGNANTIVARGVGTLNSSGTFNLATTYTGISGNQTRCATTVNDSTWFIGDQGGFYSNGSSSPSPSGNIRGVKSFGGTVYAFVASASLAPVGTISSATGGSYTALPGLANGATSRQDFYLISSAGNQTYDVLYVLDATSATAGTIFKYSLVSGSWTANGSYATAFGGFGICASLSGGGAVLYVTSGTGSTAANKVMQLTDTAGYNSTIAITTANNVTLYTAAAGTTIKGIAFAPIPAPAAPIVTSSDATAIGTTTATLNGNVTSDGGTAIVDRGFVYKTSAGVTIGDNKTTVSGTTGAYVLGLSALAVDTQFFFKSYAINSVGTTLSSPELSFWTLAATPVAPIVGNNPTATTLDVTIAADNNPTTAVYAIEETSSGSFVQANGSLGVSAVFQTASAWGQINVTGLSPSTTYTFQVEAQNGAGVNTGFGTSASGMTGPADTPTIGVIPASLSFPPTLVNGTSANLFYTVSGQNLTADVVITAPANFEVSIASGSGFGSSLTLAQSGGTVAATTIYVRFKPTAQTAYSDNVANASSGANNPNVAVSGIGALVPSVSSQAASDLTTTGATLNGTVTATNGAAITDRGFYWKTSAGVTVFDTQLSEGGTAVSPFTKALAGLSPNTQYYYRAYAVNVVGIGLDGADTSFFTLANTPTAPTVNHPTVSTLDVTIGASDGNTSGTTYAVQEATSSKYVQADGTLDATAVNQTAATWGTVTVMGLSLGTVYEFKVKAANGAGVETAFGPGTTAATANNPFTPGDLALYRVGTGNAALSSAATAVFVDELTTAGTLVQSVPLPSTGDSAFANSGSASSEGALMLSPDGQRLCFAGYNAVAGTASVASSSAARAVGTLDPAATFTLVAASSSQYTGNNFRSAATDGADNFWGAGQTSGTYYFGLASAAAEIQNTAANTRVINIFNGNLYFSASSGSFKGISVIPGIPTTAASPTLIINDANSAYGFALNPAGTIAYVADDTASESGGILRYDYSGGGWSLTYTLGTGVANLGARGLTVDWSGPNPVIYATTAESSANRLIAITDAGSDSTATTLATAAANTIFRGVAFAPKNAQTIAFDLGNSLSKTFGDSSFADTATASSGLVVTYSSDNASVATVDAAGTVTIVGAGTAHILADQPGNTIYGAAPRASQALTVLRADSIVTAWPAASSIACGQSLAASILTGGSTTPTGTFAFTFPATVPDAGTAPQSVTFTPTDAADYNTVTGTVSVTVDPGAAGGTASPAISAICSGSGVSIGLSGQTGTIVEWQSSTDNWTTTNDIVSTDNPLNTGPLLVATAFRAVVQSGLCGVVLSSSATVTVDSVTVGGTASASVSTICSGAGTSIGLSGQTGAILKWQSSSDGWITTNDIASTDNPLITGALTMTTEFRAVVQSGVCSADDSSVATVTVLAPPMIITDATNQVVCVGMPVTWSVVATGNGLSYQWQRDGTNLLEGAGNFTGTTNSTLTNSAVAMEDALDASRGYACVVSGVCAPMATSSQVSLEVDPPSVGGTASAAVATVCAGSGTSIGLSGQTGAILKWQSTTDNWAMTNEIASTDNPLVTGPLTLATLFRAVVQSGVCGAAVSSEASISVDPVTVGGVASAALSIVCSGSGTSVGLSGQTGGILKWQYSTDGGSSWLDIVSTDNPLTAGPLTTATAYRAVVQSGVCAAATSSVATVSIGTAPAIITDVTNQSACTGMQVTWSVGAIGTGISYQWQRDGTNLVEGVGNFTGTTNSTLTNSAVVLEDALVEAGRGYVCVVGGICGPTAFSSQVSLMVEPSPVGGIVSPALSTVCSGIGATVSLSGQTGMVVKWQYSMDGGNDWLDIDSSDTSMSADSLTATIEFRAVVQSGMCGYATSSVAIVEVVPVPAIVTDITNQLACVGMPVTWSVVATGNGLSYQWQRDGTNLLEGVGNFTGTTNSTLTNSAVVLEDTLDASRGYVCVVSGTCAPSASSSMVSLTVSPESVGGTAAPALASVCGGSGTTIGLSGQTGSIIKWQISTDGGGTWQDTGSTDNPFSTGPLTAAANYRAIVQSGPCGQATSSVAIVTVAPLAGAAASDASAVCYGSGTTVRLSGQTGTVVKWQFSTDGGNTWSDIVSSDSSLPTGGLTQTSRFRAVVQSGNCAAVYSSPATVSVDSLSAEASFTTIVCHGGSSTVTVSATGGTGPYSGTGQFSALAGPHDYTVSDTLGCSATVHVEIPEPAAALVVQAGDTQEVYAGSSAMIGGNPTASGGLAPYTYHWLPVAGLNNPTLANCVATPAATTVYTVTATDANGCSVNASVTIVVDPTPPHEPMGPSSRKTPIVISEIMYKPAPRADTNNLEFIEIYNSNPWFEDIGGFRIVGDNMSYTIPTGTILNGGAYLVVAASPPGIQAAYGITNVLGPYTGSLKKSGTLELLDEQGAVLLTVPYSNVYPWPVAALGTGHSIVLANPTYGEGDPRAWAISDIIGGSPGKIDSFHPSALRDVVINEVLAHSESPGVPRFVELYNHSTQTNDLSGCILTDDATTNKFVVPANTLVGPGGFVSFDETQLGFALNGGGGMLYFIKPDGSRILDAMQYGAQADGVSVGRWPDGADAYYPLASRTPGTNNSDILIGDIVINELMYHPISDNDDDQYIELFNKGTNSVDLSNWMFTAGVTFTFPGGVTLAPNGYLVVARNLTNLLAKYPNLNSGNALGNYSGKLSHSGERIALAMPQILTGTNSHGAPTTNTIFVVEDELTYSTGGRWGEWSDGGGSSLELIDPRANHRLAANWADSDETQKSSWVNIEATGVLDNGQNYGTWIQYAQFGLLDVGECLVDNVEVRAGVDGPNLATNPDFETGLSNWSLQGDHVRSTVESPGYASNHALHVRCSDRLWTGDNCAQVSLNTNTLAEGQTATLRFKARWLRGWPEALLRLNGNWLEATGPLAVPANLGSPGGANSVSVSNAGPAVYEVHHSPEIPATGQPVVVTARAHDADGLQSLVLNYRLDPSTNYTVVPMKDDGTGGDSIAGDGLFSATIPGQGSNTLVAFYISATDTRGATTRFPALLTDNTPVRECLVLFGDGNFGGSFGVYHLWITLSNATRWMQLEDLSNESHDCTIVDGTRVIYNCQAHFSGSAVHQDFTTPYGNPCHYKWIIPGDDLLLGASSFNKMHQPGNAAGDDPSIQREDEAATFLRAVGVPWLHRRFVAVYVNGNRRGTLMADTQTPNKDFVREYFPNDSDGWLYKMIAWNEFAPQLDGDYFDFLPASWCNLMPYTTTGGVKKKARYRWNYEVRRTPDSANNFTNIYAMVDAASTYGTPGYVANMENLADMENWMRDFAANHAAGNRDSFGAINSQNVYAYIGALGTKFSLLTYDFNVGLGNFASFAPGQGLFAGNDQDPNTGNIFKEPTFRRMYWRALKELVHGPLDLGNSGPVLDAKYQTFTAHGFSVENPASAIKPWISAAHDSIASQLAQEDTTNFSAQTSLLVSNGVAYISGVAPVEVKTIWFNGVEWPITWTTVTNWVAQVSLQPGTNQFAVTGIDIHGQPIAGDTDHVTVVSGGGAATLASGVVINEIMYNPGLAGAQYVELYNASSNLTYDLSGYQVLGLNYTFPQGSMMAPGQFLVLAANRSAFEAAYGAAVPVFDTFGGSLPIEGETLSLISSNGQVATQVRYQNRAPWPADANGTWSSVQLIDPTQDNWRAGNWTAMDPNSTPSPWSYYTATGTSSGSSLDIYPLSAGDIYIDDIKLVSGSVPEVGANVLADGDFETGFPGPWGVSSILTDSGLSTTVRHSGNASLHVVASAGGEARPSAIYQDISPGLPSNQPYTLSFWALEGTNPPAGGLEVRLAGSGLATIANPSPPAAAIGLFTPGTHNSVAAPQPPFQPLWINELEADNQTGITNSAGQRTAWLEIYNPTTNTVSLDGLWLANNYSNLAQWPFPTNATVNPGEFKIIFADGMTNLSTASELHANFTLSSGSGSLALTRLYSNQLQVLDFVDYTNVPANYSYGSFPNGQSFMRQPFYAATPGNSNLVVSLPAQSFIPYNSPGLVYSQNFDDLPNPGAQSVNSGNPVTINGVTYSLANPFGFASPVVASGNVGGLGISSLAGWYGMADPSASVGTRFGATDGDQTTGGVISFGPPNSGNRALGLLATSSTGFTAFGAKFVNGTVQTLTRMTLQVKGEVWRQSNLPKTLQFYYYVDPTAATGFSTNYTALISALDVNFPTVAADAGGVAVDGTSSLNQTNLGVVNQAINWPPGAALWLVWEMADPTGKAQGLGVDNLVFSSSDQVTAVPVTLSISQDATNFTFNWPTLVGQVYQPEYNENLGTTNWLPLGPPIEGTGNFEVFTNSITPTNRFFRLKLILP